jgi:hypothetical protein
MPFVDPADRHLSFHHSLQKLRYATGIVIPVYLPVGPSHAQSVALLRDTVMACREQVVDPRAICLGVDGKESGAAIAEQLVAEYGVEMVVSSLNRGKLQGVREGMHRLLARPDLRYLAVLDCDNDHFANELLNFIRAAEHIVDQTANERLMILGRRISRHHPMGLLRGELEELADRLLLQALTYHAALADTPLRLEYATLLDGVPDFHSGYKLFSRQTASDVFLPEPKTAGLSETATYRHAVEAVMTVEAVLNGARLGVINRSTFNRQPVTTFGLLNRAQLTADMILWPCKRLGVPAHFVRQWMENEIGALLLGTLVPEGRQELEGVYKTVVTAYSDDRPSDHERDPFAKQSLFL